MATKILIADPLDKKGVEILKSIDGAIVEEKGRLSEDELIKEIPHFDALVVRSGTKVTAKVLEHAKKLKFIGRAGVGLDNVDLAAATKKGIIVMNTPEGNTISTAEHAMSLIMALARNIPQAYMSLKEGKWDRKKYTGTELYGKVLGVIGLGRIGREVAKRAQAFNMKIIGYDPYLSLEKFKEMNIESMSIDEICQKADIITVHTPLNDSTYHLIDEKRISLMKKSAMLINCARGGIVDEAALKKALEEGRIKGAAFDVFEQEPPKDLSLLSFPNFIATPHLGASTTEAQINVSLQIANQLKDALEGKAVINAANYPSIDPAVYDVLYPFISLGEKLGSFIAQTFEGRPEYVNISCLGPVFMDYDIKPIKMAVLKGLLSNALEERVNYVNAEYIAIERGIEVKETKLPEANLYQNMVSIKIKGSGMENTISGSIFKKNEPRIVEVDGFNLEAVPQGWILVTYNADMPGLIGQVGTILGKEKINIAAMTFGRSDDKKKAIMAINLDNEAGQNVLKEIEGIKGVQKVKLVYIA